MWKYRKRYRMMPDMYRSYLESDVKALDKDSVIRDLNKVYFENRGFLTDYHLMQNELFAEAEQTEFPAKRLDISARYQGVKISFASLLIHLEEDIDRTGESDQRWRPGTVRRHSCQYGKPEDPWKDQCIQHMGTEDEFPDERHEYIQRSEA